MQNSDLRLVLTQAVENADDRLLQMLYAITKSYQLSNASAASIAKAADSVEAQTTEARAYRDDRPRRVVRTYRKPKTEATPAPVVAETKATPRVIKATSTSTPTRRTTTTPTRIVRVADQKEAPRRVVKSSGDGDNRSRGSFINDLKRSANGVS